MFKKKKEKKPKKAAKKQKTEELPEIAEISETPGMEGEELQSIIGDVLKGSGIEDVSTKLDEINRKFDEFQAKIERHDSMIGSLQNELNELRKTNEEMQDNIKRLLDIYEIVAQRINPFIDMSEKKELPPISEEAIIPATFPEEKKETFIEEKLPVAVPPMSEAYTPKETQVESRGERIMTEHGEERKERQFGRPILTYIKRDYYTIVLLMRWIEFLFERVKRDKITLLLDYYVDIGWISKEVKSEIMAYARGEVQDVTKYFPEEEIEAEIEMPEGTIKTPRPRMYKKVEDWRLSAEDHLKSLLFVMKIAGIEVNKDKLNSLEQEIEKFKKSLWEYHGV